MIHATPLGDRLARRYLEPAGTRVLTVDLALAELSAKLAREDRSEEIRTALSAVEAASEIVPLSPQSARDCGPLLVELRGTDRNASLADAVMLAVARNEGARLVSGDPCYSDQKDVVSA